MDDWLWWVVVAGVLGLVEILTTTLVFAMLAVGGVAAAVAAALGVGVVVQAAVFGVVAVAMLAGVRPLARRHLVQRPGTASGVAALVGAQALVLERVDAHSGRIKLAGEVWSARSYDATATFEAGASVDVVAIEGATAIVL